MGLQVSTKYLLVYSDTYHCWLWNIAPQTPLGQLFASIIMILGYGIIAVPTGIVTAEMTKTQKIDVNTQACPYCMNSDHKEESIYCHQCGKPLNDVE